MYSRRERKLEDAVIETSASPSGKLIRVNLPRILANRKMSGGIDEWPNNKDVRESEIDLNLTYYQD